MLPLVPRTWTLPWTLTNAMLAIFLNRGRFLQQEVSVSQTDVTAVQLVGTIMAYVPCIPPKHMQEQASSTSAGASTRHPGCCLSDTATPGNKHTQRTRNICFDHSGLLAYVCMLCRKQFRNIIHHSPCSIKTYCCAHCDISCIAYAINSTTNVIICSFDDTGSAGAELINKHADMQQSLQR